MRQRRDKIPKNYQVTAASLDTPAPEVGGPPLSQQLTAALLDTPVPEVGSPPLRQQHQFRASPGNVILEAASFHVPSPIVGGAPETPRPPNQARRQTKLDRVYGILIEFDQAGRIRDDMQPREYRKIVKPAYRARYDEEVSARRIGLAWAKFWNGRSAK